MVLSPAFKRYSRYFLISAGFAFAIFLVLMLMEQKKKTKEQFQMNAKSKYDKIVNDLQFDEFSSLKTIDDFHKKYYATEFHKKLNLILRDRGLSIDNIFETWTVRNILKAKKMVVKFYNDKGFFPGEQAMDIGIDSWGKPLWLDVNPEKPKKDTNWVFSINSRGINGIKDATKMREEDDDLNIFVDKKEFDLLTLVPENSSIGLKYKRSPGKPNEVRSKSVTIKELLGNSKMKRKK